MAVDRPIMPPPIITTSYSVESILHSPLAEP
jgi:hypothetical protein